MYPPDRYNEHFDRPENVRCLMGYVVDLTLIMQAVFQASLGDQDGIVTQERAKEMVGKFDKSEKKADIHAAIRSFASAQNPFTKDAAMDRIEDLIEKNK